MRAVKSLVLLFFVATSAVGGGPLKPGFRDLSWGDPAPDTMTKVEQEGDTTWYERPGDRLSIGDVPLEMIGYEFYKGRFAGAAVTVAAGKGPDLLLVLEEQWGLGYRKNSYIQDWAWRSVDPELGGTTAYYDENSMDRSATLLIWSVDIRDEKERDAKEAAKKAADDL